jgi:hypothetical protein
MRASIFRNRGRFHAVGPWLTCALIVLATLPREAAAQEPTPPGAGGQAAPPTADAGAAPALSSAPAAASETGAQVAPSAEASAQAGIEPAAEAAPTEPAAEAAPTEEASAAGWGDLTNLEEESTEEAPIFRTKLYGFIDYHAEKVAKTPDSVDENGRTVKVKNPWELDILNLNIMVQGSIYDKYRYFINIAGPSSGSNIDDVAALIRNAWVEAPIWSRYIIARAGKTYRRFGLYNEILDAVPTFIGIEAPEMFDKDHLLITRTTNLMLHGSVDIASAVLNYSFTTGADERDAGSFPFGADLNVELPFGLKIGSSMYTSGGDAVPSRAVGDGSPKGGVINWMSKDKYNVFGGYVQLRKAGLILQAEYWAAMHNGTRDGDSMALLAADGSLNPTQMNRFFVNGDPSMGYNEKAKYTIQTGYLRAGYEITIGQLASITPYLQFDYYKNPEIVNNKDLGGDNEAGLTDDGQFEKYTIGAVMRPVSQVAAKVDASGHRQKFNGKSEFYPEVRFSISYLWELAL